MIRIVPLPPRGHQWAVEPSIPSWPGPACDQPGTASAELVVNERSAIDGSSVSQIRRASVSEVASNLPIQAASSDRALISTGSPRR